MDTAQHPGHCGECFKQCADGKACVGGTCVDNTCTSPQLLCSNGCQYVPTDVANCGLCGVKCTANGQWCADGRCRCADGQITCDGKCTGPTYDKNNCGQCGIKCDAEGQYCDGGKCRCGGPDEVVCNGRCQPASACGATGTGGASSGGASSGGASSGGGGSVTPGSDGEFCGNGSIKRGHATYYELATPLAHCSYATSTLPKYYGAIAGDIYAKNVCGACVEVTGLKGTKLTVQIVDECPYVGNEQWCYSGSNHIDLSLAAFDVLSNNQRILGHFPITWKYVPCAPSGKVQYTWKDGSTIWWTGIMVRNYPAPIAKLEYKNASGVWKSLAHQSYNYWLDEKGFGTGPYSLRLTDQTGAVVVQDGIPSLTSKPEAGTSSASMSVQFPACK